MTDANSGSANTGQPNAGANAANAGSTNVGGGGENSSWLSGLQDAGNRDLATKKGWDKSNSPDVVITSYRELESKLGKSIVVPEATAPREDFDKLYTALGKPKTPGDYAFKLPQGVPENFPYDDGFATDFKNWSHDAGLSPRQASHLHDAFVQRTAKQMADSQTALLTKVGEAHQQITAKWGPTDSQAYRTNVADAEAGMNGLGIKDSLKASGLLTQDGKITDAKMAFALATVGAGLFKESKDRGGQSPGTFTASNPWKDGQENLTEQANILKTNPDLARSLIVAAGKDPKVALWSDPRAKR